MVELKVEICSHFFRATQISARAKPAIVEFAKKAVQWGMMRVPRPGAAAGYRYSPLRVFAAATEDRTEYRFHINQLKEFQQHLEFHKLVGEMVEFSYRPMYDPEKVELVIKPEWTDRDHQVPVIEYITAPPPPNSKLVELQTGKGKSYCAMRGMQKFGFRTAILVRPMYIEKWLEDLHRTYNLRTEDVMVVQGGTHLMKLIELAMSGELESKIVLISNKTVQGWLKLYERLKEEIESLGYGCMPDQLMQVLKAGMRLIDEVHQDFHLNYKLDLYTHVPLSLSLSATLISDDAFLNKMYEVAYPNRARYKGGAYHKYAAAYAVLWRAAEPEKIRTREFGSKTYSHHAVEKSIARNKQTQDNYLKLINTVVKMGHFREQYKPGHKCLIFCAGIDFCTTVQQYLQKLYPNLKVNRYVEEDPFENLNEGDIIVSTLLSAGTAVDVPNLFTVILTTAVQSSPANLQGFGRLRELKDGTQPAFYYFVCEDIPKHVEYHEKKKELLQDRAAAYKSLHMPGVV
jgi:superfamily II DNA or RNA helicase